MTLSHGVKYLKYAEFCLMIFYLEFDTSVFVNIGLQFSYNSFIWLQHQIKLIQREYLTKSIPTQKLCQSFESYKKQNIRVKSHPYKKRSCQNYAVGSALTGLCQAQHGTYFIWCWQFKATVCFSYTKFHIVLVSNFPPSLLHSKGPPILSLQSSQ